MQEDYLIRTDRLGLRRWKEEDHEPFARMNADERVMRYFPSTLSREESKAFVRRIEDHFDRYGCGLYATCELASGRLIGFIGLQMATFEADFTPCMEIGWRLHRDFWGRGYATEGARACLDDALTVRGYEEICSFTSVLNIRSIAVMERLGLIFRRRFGHPRLDPASRLYEHVLYSLKRSEYAELRGANKKRGSV